MNTVVFELSQHMRSMNRQAAAFIRSEKYQKLRIRNTTVGVRPRTTRYDISGTVMAGAEISVSYIG